MNSLTNPTAVRMFFVIGTVVFLVCAAALPYAVVRFRRSLAASSELNERPSGTLMSPDGFAFATFQQTIRELKEREKELQTRIKNEKERADSASALVRNLLAGIPSPAITFNSVAIIQSANPAARELFGRASLVGFSLKNLFGDAVIGPQTIDAVEIPAVSVSELIREALRGEKSTTGLSLECEVRTGVRAVLELSVIADKAGAGVVLITKIVDSGKGACTDEVPSIAETPCSSNTEPS